MLLLTKVVIVFQLLILLLRLLLVTPLLLNLTIFTHHTNQILLLTPLHQQILLLPNPLYLTFIKFFLKSFFPDIFPATLPVQGTVAFCINCGRTGHSASECMAPENVRQEEQVRAAWCAPLSTQLDNVDSDNQIRVISVAEAGGPSHPVIVTCGEKQV